jgi:hypothetical protein
MASTEPWNTLQTTANDSTWSSAPKLSRKVRELAHRSFRALKTASQADGQTQAPSNEILQDLRDLRDQVARLQHKIHERNLESLIPWVDALRHKVEDRLGPAARMEN